MLNKFSFESLNNLTINKKVYSADAKYINDLFKLQKGNPQTFLVLSLFYENISLKGTEMHQDHLHPEKFFRGKKWKDNFPNKNEKDYNFYQDNYNCLANLQFLSGAINSGVKNDTPLDEWLKNNPAIQIVCLPSFLNGVNYDYEKYHITNFKEFIEERKQLMANKLEEIFKND